MKLLQVAARLDREAGGVVEALVCQSNVLLEMGADVEIVSLDAVNELDRSTIDFIGKVHLLGKSKRFGYRYTRYLNVWLNDNLSNYDAVIIHGIWQYHSFATSRICRKLKIPYFIFPHGMLDPWFNSTYPLKHLKKLLYWFWGENPGLRHATAVLFTNEEERLLARRSFPLYRVNEQVVGMGTTVPAFEFEAGLNSSKFATEPWAERPYFLFMSRVQEKKGLDLLVQAYSGMRVANPAIPELVIAGLIQQEAYANRIKRTYSQSGIHWVGMLSGVEKWQVLAAAEVMVLISHQENFGMIVAEALASGTPVLISNKVNIWREVQASGAGLVGTDTPEGAIELIQTWLTQTSEERELMISATRNAFIERFEIHHATQRLVSTIQQLL